MVERIEKAEALVEIALSVGRGSCDFSAEVAEAGIDWGLLCWFVSGGASGAKKDYRNNDVGQSHGSARLTPERKAGSRRHIIESQPHAEAWGKQEQAS